MKSMKRLFFVALAIITAIFLAPFVAVFGFMILGLAFGLALIATSVAAALTVADMSKGKNEESVQSTEEPVGRDMGANAQQA